MPTKRPFRITARYLVAVGFIYLCTACAWLYLGKVTQNRTEDRDYTLRAEVGRLWGGQHNQFSPGVTLSRIPTPLPVKAQGWSRWRSWTSSAPSSPRGP